MSTSFCLQVFSNASQDKDLDRKCGNCGHILPHFSDATLSWWLSWSKYSSAAKSQNATVKVNFTGENDNLAKVYQRLSEFWKEICFFSSTESPSKYQELFLATSHFLLHFPFDWYKKVSGTKGGHRQAASDSGLQLVWALHNWSLASLIATQQCSTMIVLNNCTATAVS